jgi:hypothetical protein
MTSIPAPVPGVYPGTPMDIYHAWEAASNSRLTKLRRSPAHMKASLSEPQDTPALRIGRAAHSAILEPDDFMSRYACGPSGDKRTKDIKAAWESLEMKHGEEYVLKGVDYDACLEMRDAVYAHSKASKLLIGAGEIELSTVWTVPVADGSLTCKARLDRYTAGIAGGAVVDVKTTRDASPRAFERAIFDLGYHRQGAFYLDAARAHGIPAEHFVIVAVEKEAPYAVAVYRLTEGALDAGREQLQPLLRTYAMCQTLNEWPAYPETVQDIALPSYAWSQIDEEIAA